jgi:E3 ubiquitin-protein ligase RNF217
MRRAPTKVQCVECNLIWCFQCHSPWHDGIQCKEFRRGDRMLKKWAREVHYGQHNAQQCPSCKVNLKKIFFFPKFHIFFSSKGLYSTN